MSLEQLRQVELDLRRQTALAAARLEAHRTRCGACATGRGVYEGLCLLGARLRREREALGRPPGDVQAPR